MPARYRKRTYRKRRNYTRRFKRNYRRSRRTGQRKYLFKRTVATTINLTTNSVGFYPLPSANNQFKLSNLPSYTELTVLYDTYKICAVKRKYVFDRNMSSVSQGALPGPPYGMPTLLTVNDYNDADTLTNEPQMLQYQTYKARRLDRVVSRYFKPRFFSSTSNIAATRGYITTVENSIVHYGLKTAVSVPVDVDEEPIGTLKIYDTYYISCKTVR